MKFVLLVAIAPSVAALQSNYLSQLNRINGGSASVAQVNGFGGTAVAPAPAFGLEVATPSGKPSHELLDLWSNQVSVELSASQLYLSASIWFSARGYKGMSAWMLDESGEERGHGLAILDFAKKKKFPVTLKPLDAPRSDWETPVEVWEDILKAEQTNTQNLLRLAAAADECGEYGCVAFLQPFHIEQIDAEEKVGGILATVKGAPSLMMELDHELGLEAEEEEGH